MKLIAFYEDQWMPPGTDYQQWRHLGAAFGCNVQLVRDWTEAIIPDGHRVIVADENGELVSGVDPIPNESVLVFGRSAQSIIGEIPHDESIRVTTPNATSLFGVCAAACILSDLRWLSR